MNNKYEITKEEQIGKYIKLYTMKDKKNHEYSCLTQKELDGKIHILSDDNANIFDISEALFQNDLDIIKELPSYLVTPNMERVYNDYYPGKVFCIYKNDEEFLEVYKEEERRTQELIRGKILVK